MTVTRAPRSLRAAGRAAAGGTPGRALDRSCLVTWLTTRVGVAVVSMTAALALASTAAGVPSFDTLWNRWDVGLFIKIARFGYRGYPGHYPDRGVAAFFPGEPLLLRAVHVAIPDWVAAGIVVSGISSAIACVALGRLGDMEGGGPVGRRAVRFLMLSPFAVFLFAGYSEAPFLALALPAWLAARRRRWAAAGLLAAGATAFRVTGVFLAAALAVEYLRAGRDPGPSRRSWNAGWLLAPWAVAAGYAGYLYAITGDWLAWPHAQQVGWGRALTWPWQALATTWGAAWDPAQPAAYAWSFRGEILAVAVGVALTVALLVRRRWAEAVYVGLQVAAFATSSYYLSVARASLLWWPLWLLLARAAGRWRWVQPAYLTVAPALMLGYVVVFTQGQWVG